MELAIIYVGFLQKPTVHGLLSFHVDVSPERYSMLSFPIWLYQASAASKSQSEFVGAGTTYINNVVIIQHNYYCVRSDCSVLSLLLFHQAPTIFIYLLLHYREL
jgi:hypothetical protein